MPLAAFSIFSRTFPLAHFARDAAARTDRHPRSSTGTEDNPEGKDGSDGHDRLCMSRALAMASSM
jgi:hypothetical protein